MSPVPKPEVDIGLLQSGPGAVSAPGPTFGDPNFGVPNDQGQPEVDIALLPGVPGQRGPKGDTGPQGPVGPTPVIAYTHTQNVAQLIWTITHNLGFYPNVTTTDAAKFSIEGAVTYINTNTVQIEFGIATTGFAYLS